MTKELAAAIEELRRIEQPLALHLLHYDAHLRSFCGAWPTFRVESLGVLPLSLDRKRDGVVDLRIAAWQAFNLDRLSLIAQARRALGPTFPVSLKLDQAVAGNLVLPDGTLHPAAEWFLARREEQKRRPLMTERERERLGSDASPDPDRDPPPGGGGSGRSLQIVQGGRQASQDDRSATITPSGDQPAGPNPATRRRAVKRARAKAAARGES